MEFSQSVDALIGLAAFPAEQVPAMSLSKNGLDLDWLWERKCQAVEQTPGLTIWRGGETFDQIGGCENIKRFLTAVLLGREAPRVIVFVDEIEKAFTGTGTDMSGVKTEMTGTMLSWMQDHSADGLIFIGSAWGRKECGWQSGGRNGRHPHGRLRSFSDAKLARWRIWQETACSASGRRCDLAGAEPLDRDVQFDNESSTRTATLIHIGTFFFDLPSA